MTSDEKISILSASLSKHLRNLRKLGGAYSLSAIEECVGEGYKCEIAWSGLRQQHATVSKKTKEEAGEDIAKVLIAILGDELEGLRAFVIIKTSEAEAIEKAILSVENTVEKTEVVP